MRAVVYRDAERLRVCTVGVGPSRTKRTCTCAASRRCVAAINSAGVGVTCGCRAAPGCAVGDGGIHDTASEVNALSSPLAAALDVKTTSLSVGALGSRRRLLSLAYAPIVIELPWSAPAVGRVITAVHNALNSDHTAATAGRNLRSCARDSRVCHFVARAHRRKRRRVWRRAQSNQRR